MITQLSTSLYDQCLAEFEVRNSLGQQQEPEQVQQLRKQGIELFRKMGFPSTRSEEWKYTNLAPFLKEEFYLEQEEAPGQLGTESFSAFRIRNLDAFTLVTVNGKYQPDLSDSIPGTDILVLPLSEAMNEQAFASHFGRHAQPEGKPFVALNTALFHNGIFLQAKAGSVTRKPVHLIHLRTSDAPVLVQPRHLIVIGNQAELCIVESYVTLAGSAPVLVNEVSEIVIGENARLLHYTLQAAGSEATRQVQHIEVSQQPSSIFSNFKASFPGAALLRNNMHVALDGKNIESHLYGIYVADGDQVVDNHTLVDHRFPYCQSNELYKGVMNGEATGIFNGKIFVRQDAQKTNAFQQNNNLMLSEQAVVDSKPQLEIYADDVKCSHGSTVGQFDEEALFYLQTRGIGREAARGLLVHAFLFDVTDRIPDPAIQEHVNGLIEQALA